MPNVVVRVPRLKDLLFNQDGNVFYIANARLDDLYPFSQGWHPAYPTMFWRTPENKSLTTCALGNWGSGDSTHVRISDELIYRT
jgi:hypothetical protein